MARVELAREIVEDFNRILAFNAQKARNDAAARIAEIMHAIDALADNPRIGRAVANGRRELVIGRRSHGHVALYQYVDAVDAVFVLAVRSQREATFSRLLD